MDCGRSEREIESPELAASLVTPLLVTAMSVGTDKEKCRRMGKYAIGALSLASGHTKPAPNFSGVESIT
jgi:hypothetical protein